MKKLFVLNLLFLVSLTVGCSSDDEKSGEIEIPPVESATLDIASGGPTQPNQVYIDLSAQGTTVVRRDAWELGFYTGAENRVFLNSSILATAAELPGITNLNEVGDTTELKSVLELKTLNMANYQMDELTINTVEELLQGLSLGYTMYGNPETGVSFTDSKEGKLSETAIAEISQNPEENNVYVISLGSEIPTEAVEPGAINTTGESRGVYKIRIYMDGGSYVLQYAELNAEDYEEVTIPKDQEFNLTAFSLPQGSTVNVEPPKDEWDINYTSVYSFYGNLGGIVAGVTYSDYVLYNSLNGVGVYTVITSETDEDGNVTATDAVAYEDFSAADIQETEFIYDNRALIGSDWRSTSEGVKSDRYYIIKDTDGNSYKLQFTAMLNASGERGYPQFKYELL